MGQLASLVDDEAFEEAKALERGEMLEGEEAVEEDEAVEEMEVIEADDALEEAEMIEEAEALEEDEALEVDLPRLLGLVSVKHHSGSRTVNIQAPYANGRIIFPLSAMVWLHLLKMPACEMVDDKFTASLTSVIQGGTVLSYDRNVASAFVVDCGHSIAIKSIPFMANTTEYTTLKFLENRPEIPVPRAHGLVKCGSVHFMFMDLVPGKPLSSIWGGLTVAEKTVLSREINSIMLHVRSLENPNNGLLGGVGGEGCLDVHRHYVYTTDSRITDSQGYWEFLVENVPEKYQEQMRHQYVPRQPSRCVFTHGDLRADNIMASRAKDSVWHVEALLDWEHSGFYPEHVEATRARSTFSTDSSDQSAASASASEGPSGPSSAISSSDEDRPFSVEDWRSYLPEVCQVSSFEDAWLADRVIGSCMD